MDNQDTFRGFLFIFLSGICLGMVLQLLIIDYIPHTTNYDVRILRQECEKSLPRDQHCILTTIPEK